MVLLVLYFQCTHFYNIYHYSFEAQDAVYLCMNQIVKGIERCQDLYLDGWVHIGQHCCWMCWCLNESHSFFYWLRCTLFT